MWLCLYLQASETSYYYSSIVHVITHFNACLVVSLEIIPDFIFSFLHYWTLRAFLETFLTESHICFSTVSVIVVGMYFLGVKNMQLSCKTSHLEHKHYYYFSFLFFLYSEGTRKL